MYYFNVKITVSEEFPSMESEIRELVCEYLSKKNLTGNCFVHNNTFLSFFCKEDNRIIKKIRQEDILFIEKNRRKVTLYTKHGDFTINSSLKKLEEKLDPALFYRVHQGYIVNINDIKQFFSSELSLLSCNRMIPVSRRNRSKLNAISSDKPPIA